jgi:hypothetical protein
MTVEVSTLTQCSCPQLIELTAPRGAGAGLAKLGRLPMVSGAMAVSAPSANNEKSDLRPHVASRTSGLADKTEGARHQASHSWTNLQQEAFKDR